MTMFLFFGSERNTTLTKIEGSLPTLQIENSAAHPLPAEHAMPSHCSHWICCLALVPECARPGVTCLPLAGLVGIGALQARQQQPWVHNEIT